MTTVNLTSHAGPNPRKAQPAASTRSASMEPAPFAPSPVFERLQRGGGGMPLTWLAIPAGLLAAGALIYTGMNAGGTHVSAVAPAQPAQPTAVAPPTAPVATPTTANMAASTAPAPLAIRRAAPASSVRPLSTPHRAMATRVTQSPTSGATAPTAVPWAPLSTMPQAASPAPAQIAPPAAQSSPALQGPSALAPSTAAPADASGPVSAPTTAAPATAPSEATPAQ